MSKFKKLMAGVMFVMALLLSSTTVAYADDIGAGGTGEGDGSQCHQLKIMTVL